MKIDETNTGNENIVEGRNHSFEDYKQTLSFINTTMKFSPRKKKFRRSDLDEDYPL